MTVGDKYSHHDIVTDPLKNLHGGDMTIRVVQDGFDFFDFP